MWRQRANRTAGRGVHRVRGERRDRGAEAGQSMVEYAIVAALIAIVAMTAVQALGGGVVQVFERILTQIQSMG